MPNVVVFICFLPFFSPFIMSQVSRIGFVVFGLGRAGHIHATNLIKNPQASLKWIVDIDEEKAKEFVTSSFQETQVVTPSDTEAVLRDPNVHAAVITTPTHLHEDIVMRCLQAGKAVFCEKPVATTVEAIGENLFDGILAVYTNHMKCCVCVWLIWRSRAKSTPIGTGWKERGRRNGVIGADSP